MKPLPIAAIQGAQRELRTRIESPLLRGKDNSLADLLDYQLKVAKAPLYDREFRITPERKFRADFYFSVARLVVEVEGGGWIQGRHSQGYGLESDCEKSALIARMPARLIRVTSRHVRNGHALDWILKIVSP